VDRFAAHPEKELEEVRHCRLQEAHPEVGPQKAPSE
jgi:hypothetical protein